MKWYRFRKREIKKFAHDLGTLGRVIKPDGTVEITLHPQALTAIALKAQEVHDAKGFSTLELLKVGIAGQAAVFYELRGNWLEGVKQMKIGEPDDYDIVYRSFRNEIKTFNIQQYKPYNPNGREPDSVMPVKTIKFHERHDSFYTGCLLVSSDKIEIMGFLTREEMELLDKDPNAHENYSGWKNSELYNPDDDCIVVRKKSQFTSITKLDSIIDSMAARDCKAAFRKPWA